MRIQLSKRFLLCFFFIPVSVFAQTLLKKEYNMLRGGDVIIKQQRKYKNPGRAGANVLWDFGKQEAVNVSCLI
ncbi:hypothetical protein [uncultured Bacteroides sp.]|uniref:hypothetical protein n=1 Tax=uncultured Bacteroides sp. TaxID=162156 RepID=UPI002AA859ED|nr:hypothetical protein [uncultured Bacteroides sp.]